MRPCGVCGQEAVSSEAMERLIKEYVQSLPETIRASDETVAKRLSYCAACAHQREGTCVLCGCFVEARAAKWQLTCPDAARPRWGVGEMLTI